MDRDMIGTVPGAHTVLADGEDLAALKQDGHVLAAAAGLVGVTCGMGKYVGIQSAGDPRGERIGLQHCHFVWSVFRSADRSGDQVFRTVIL